MAHIPPNPGPPGGSETRRDRRPLGAVRRYQSPHLAIITRAAKPPVPRLKDDDEREKAHDVAASVGGGIKREIRGFSGQSALNFARVLSILDWSKHGQCIYPCLTYADEYPRDKRALQRAKAEIVRDVGRHCECGFWRLEFQKRGAPHWHLLLWIGDRDPVAVEQWLREWWWSYSGNTSDYACKVVLSDQVRARWYTAMHAAKGEQAPPYAVGRWWGYINRDTVLAASDIHSHGEISERERVWWARLFRRATGCKTRQGQGLSWFLPRASQCVVDSWIQRQIESEKVRPRNPF